MVAPSIMKIGQNLTHQVGFWECLMQRMKDAMSSHFKDRSRILALCDQDGFWEYWKSWIKEVTRSPEIILEPSTCLKGTGMLSINFVYTSKGKATGRRYFPPLCATIGWALPAGYIEGRYI